MNIQAIGNPFDFIDALPEEDRANVRAHLESLRLSEKKRLLIKTLKGKIKELIVQQYRIVFVIIGETIFITDVFKKQSQKTPKRIIAHAEKIYQHIKHNY